MAHLFKLFSTIILIVNFFQDGSCFVPRESPTKGYIWPKPRDTIKKDGKQLMAPQNFNFQVIGTDCQLLQDALVRYKAILVQQADGRPKPQEPSDPGMRVMTNLMVNLTQPCQQWPSYNMTEEYTITISDTEPSSLSSDSIWGILRGLDSFSHMVYLDNFTTGELMINNTIITDGPRFSHRGLLLDTCRHFISMPNIYKILDGMAYNKLNVFHWHIVDDTCFPYVSVTFPTLSEKGAYLPHYIYTQEDVKNIIEYARVRGIRVIPEFDTPGHTKIWGEAFPRLLTKCYGPDGQPDGEVGPLHVIDEYIYTFMQSFYEELVSVFPDEYVHLGGDEVDFDCWKSNPEINQYMAANNLTSYIQLEGIYIKRLLKIVDDLKGKSVVWQEVLFNGAVLPEGTVVQGWLGDSDRLMEDITSKGLPAILSSCWYLDELGGKGRHGGDWRKFYNCEPLNFSGTAAQKKLVIGGEACMWGEVVDDNNIVQRIFPRVSAVAEKLWSPMFAGYVDEARFRLEEHYCRMNKRGIPAQPPNGPGFCA